MAKAVDMTQGKPAKLLLQFAFPVFIGNLFQQLYTLVDRVIVGQFVGASAFSAIGAFTATTQMETLVQQIYAALGTAMVTYTGQNIGAGKTDRIKQGMKSAMGISSIISVILLAVFWIGGNLIMSIFVPDTEITSLATRGIRITSLFFMALGVVQVLRFLLNGAGDSLYALLNGIVEIIARIGFVLLLTSIPAIGMWGIWLTTGLTWLATALFALWRYKSGAWTLKALVKEKEENYE